MLRQQGAGGDDPHDLVGAFEDLVHAQVADQLLDAEVGEVAVAAEELQRAVGDLEGGVGDEALGHRAGHRGVGGTGVELPGGLVEEDACRLQLAWKLDHKTPDASKACAMAKRLVTDTAFKVANDALQLLGGYGYLADYGIEKIVRDLRVHQILEGTNEIMRVIIARALTAEPR